MATVPYLTPDDPGAFKDLPVLKKGEYWGAGEMCPKCKGHGKWHLELDAYGKGRHFDAVCGACWGWGYLAPGQTCAHEWDGPTRNVGRCLNIWTCSKCGQEREVDSSD